MEVYCLRGVMRNENEKPFFFSPFYEKKRENQFGKNEWMNEWICWRYRKDWMKGKILELFKKPLWNEHWV